MENSMVSTEQRKVNMTRERMEDVLMALQSRGWRLLDESEYSLANKDPFQLEEDGTVRWGIDRKNEPEIVELEFVAFGLFGENTTKLNDICYCKVIGTEETLSFPKRKSSEWRVNLTNFLNWLQSRPR
jgi:hypothetical protein